MVEAIDDRMSGGSMEVKGIQKGSEDLIEIG
jgi:hypothetical protein